VQLAARWLKKSGFGVVATELTFAGKGEQPDALGFRSNCSAIVEVKVSRADFLADAKKPWRTGEASLGVYRFYLCPQGLIDAAELPPRWGLLYEAKGRVQPVVTPVGNLWPSYADKRFPDNQFMAFQHQNCERQERFALYSIARRLMAATN
jgi:hypothetical protein